MRILGRNVQVSSNGSIALVLEYAMDGEPFITNTGGAKQGRNAESQEHTSKRKRLSARFLYLPLRSGSEPVGSLPRNGDWHKCLFLFRAGS